MGSEASRIAASWGTLEKAGRGSAVEGETTALLDGGGGESLAVLKLCTRFLGT